MDNEKLDGILAAHKKQLNGINLRGANLSKINLEGVNLSGAYLNDIDLSYANLSDTDLSYANLSDTDLCSTNLSYACLRGADLRGADLNSANLNSADLRGADLHNTNLSGANLRDANLSGAMGILSAVGYMKAHFERTSDGYIAYKLFGREYDVPESWNIEKGSVITENVNFDRTRKCGCGINVATLEWVRTHYGRKNYDIWKVLIRWEWLCGVCVPYNTDGNIRCERVEIVDNHIRLDEVE